MPAAGGTDSTELRAESIEQREKPTISASSPLMGED